MSDSFWDDALNEPLPAGNTGASMLGPTAPTPSPAPHVSTAPPKKKKKKQKQSAGFSWGADWAKVGGGLATFVIAGGIAVVLVITTGYLFYWPAIIAVIGLFSALAGLIGR
ncbi:hypothetical protein [Aeoliella sp.]|uniref:hypothetical protein n=1 Tax=Aeoliella sp. TaxID=2795800 RepID=UPI003CCC3AFC